MRQSLKEKADCQSNNDVWKVVQERELLRTRLGVHVSEQTIQLPDETLVSDYLQIKMPSYTTVLPVTDDGFVVCIRQYKHGIGTVALTLPGGSIEHGEIPLDSAKRELLEETGFRCAKWQELGEFVVGANQGLGRAHLFLAKNGQKVKEPDSGDLEDMKVELLAIGQLKQALLLREFPVLSHACAIALSVSHL